VAFYPFGPAVAALNEPPLLPSDLGMTAWNMDPSVPVAGTSPASGTVQLVGFPLRAAAPITNIVLSLQGAGVTLTAGENFAGLYSPAGQLIAATADQSAAWASAVPLAIPLAGGPYTLPPGWYWVALLPNAVTTPAFLRSGNVNANSANFGAAATALRFATGPTGQTSLPGTITPGSMAKAAVEFWAGLS
jgi:hypothetical protein